MKCPKDSLPVYDEKNIKLQLSGLFQIVCIKINIILLQNFYKSKIPTLYCCYDISKMYVLKPYKKYMVLKKNSQ